jgi:hypothetical protein
LYDEDLLFFDRQSNDKRNNELSLRVLELGSGDPDVTTEEPITTTSSSLNGNIWPLENVVVIEASSSGRKKRDVFYPNETFSSVQAEVILTFTFDY